MQGARCQALGVWDIKSVGEKAEDDVMIITDQNQDQNWTQLSVCHSGLPSLPPSLHRPWGTANYLGNKTDGTRDRTMHQSVIHLAEHSYPHMLLSARDINYILWLNFEILDYLWNILYEIFAEMVETQHCLNCILIMLVCSAVVRLLLSYQGWYDVLSVCGVIILLLSMQSSNVILAIL